MDTSSASASDERSLDMEEGKVIFVLASVVMVVVVPDSPAFVFKRDTDERRVVDARIAAWPGTASTSTFLAAFLAKAAVASTVLSPAASRRRRDPLLPPPELCSKSEPTKKMVASVSSSIDGDASTMLPVVCAMVSLTAPEAVEFDPLDDSELIALADACRVFITAAVLPPLTTSSALIELIMSFATLENCSRALLAASPRLPLRPANSEAKPAMMLRLAPESCTAALLAVFALRLSNRLATSSAVTELPLNAGITFAERERVVEAPNLSCTVTVMGTV
mmetsp:Transcript_50531/g.130226  ORF Transcript_50531/g.130226 Transcript_50531/m.130226 type:complete len:279 (+) Transcript_50531:1083-1919(+)